MKIVVLLLMLVFLAGCGAQAETWETVEDTIIQTEVSLSEYDITVGLPESALTDWTDNCCRYETEHLQVETSAFQAVDLNAAVRYLSGFEADKLTILQTTRFDLPEYQFAWYCQTAEGGRLCRADLVMDGMNCYVVVCSFSEEAGEPAWAEARQVFSAFGLTPAEIV